MGRVAQRIDQGALQVQLELGEYLGKAAEGVIFTDAAALAGCRQPVLALVDDICFAPHIRKGESAGNIGEQFQRQVDGLAIGKILELVQEAFRQVVQQV